MCTNHSITWLPSNKKLLTRNEVMQQENPICYIIFYLHSAGTLEKVWY